MKRQAVLFLGLGLLGGFAVSAWWSRPDSDVLRDIERSASASEREASSTPASNAARIAALEQQLAGEIGALERQLDTLRNDLAVLSGATALGPDDRPRSTPDPGGASPSDATRDATPVGNVPGNREGRFRVRSSEGRIAALTEAGFSLDRAQYIERRLEELRVEAMQARYEAARRGGSGDTPADGLVERFFDTNAVLREELGDAEYERYLSATGQSTRVDVFSVLGSSPAERAGMRAGDQIVAYAGERVFDLRALNQALLAGEPGEPVIVDVLRDGEPLQLVLPRGPLGISGGFARRER